MKTEPVLIVMSVVTFLQVLVTGGAWAEIVPAPWANLSALAVAALSAGAAFYLRGKVTPIDLNNE